MNITIKKGIKEFANLTFNAFILYYLNVKITIPLSGFSKGLQKHLFSD